MLLLVMINSSELAGLGYTLNKVFCVVKTDKEAQFTNKRLEALVGLEGHQLQNLQFDLLCC
jgi:hypothetical protein